MKSLHGAIDKFGMIKEAHTLCLVKIHDFTITGGLLHSLRYKRHNSLLLIIGIRRLILAELTDSQLLKNP